MKKLLAALIFTLSIPVWASDLDDGLQAWRTGDYSAALTFFEKAAEKGNSTAQVHLGWIYDLGLGVMKNHAKAAVWYRLAAEQGDSTAQFNLAAMHDQGVGVLQDYAEAARLYKLAATQEHAMAQYKLALMHSEGKGMPQDHTQAHMWMNIATVNGYKDAYETRDSLARQMTPQQLAKAQAMAKRCLASSYKDCE